MKDNGKRKLEDHSSEMDYDQLLTSVGELGRYQILLFFLMFPFHAFAVFVYFQQMFMTEVSPNHWCWVPELENLTEHERRALAIPADNSRFGYSRCEAYVTNWTDVILTGQTPNETWGVSKCQHGWEFNKSEIPYPTISSELGWVCDKDSYQASAQTIFFLGSVVGGFFTGWIADRFGRLSAIVISNMLGCIGGVTSAFATSFAGFATCRFIAGMSSDGCLMVAYLLVLEYVAPRYRPYMANLSFSLFYCTAAVSLPWISLSLGDWRYIGLLTSLPMGLVLFAPLILPESPQWLLSKGHNKKFSKTIQAIGRINKMEVPQKDIDKFLSSVSKEEGTETEISFLEMFKRPLSRKIFICICLVYGLCTMLFDVLVRSIGQLQFNYFITFSLVSLSECPSLLLTAFLLDVVGRRWLSFVTLTFASIFCGCVAYFGTGVLAVAFAISARFMLNFAFGTSTQWCAEVFPTPVRGKGTAIVHTVGNILAMLSPYLIYMEKIAHWLPMTMAACLCASCAVLALLLPETAKKDMPQNYEDSEEIMRNQRFWEMPCVNVTDKKTHLDKEKAAKTVVDG